MMSPSPADSGQNTLEHLTLPLHRCPKQPANLPVNFSLPSCLPIIYLQTQNLDTSGQSCASGGCGET